MSMPASARTASNDARPGPGAPPDYLPGDFSSAALFASRLRTLVFGTDASLSGARLAELAELERTKVTRALKGRVLPTWPTVHTILSTLEHHYEVKVDELAWQNMFEAAETEKWAARRWKAIMRGAFCGVLAVVVVLIWLTAQDKSGPRSAPDPLGPPPRPVVVVPDPAALGPASTLPSVRDAPSTTAPEWGKLALAEVRCYLPRSRSELELDLPGWFQLADEGWVSAGLVTARDREDITTVLTADEVRDRVRYCSTGPR